MTLAISHVPQVCHRVTFGENAHKRLNKPVPLPSSSLAESHTGRTWPGLLAWIGAGVLAGSTAIAALTQHAGTTPPSDLSPEVLRIQAALDLNLIKAKNRVCKQPKQADYCDYLTKQTQKTP